MTGFVWPQTIDFEGWLKELKKFIFASRIRFDWSFVYIRGGIRMWLLFILLLKCCFDQRCQVWQEIVSSCENKLDIRLLTCCPLSLPPSFLPSSLPFSFLAFFHPSLSSFLPLFLPPSPPSSLSFSLPPSLPPSSPPYWARSCLIWLPLTAKWKKRTILVYSLTEMGRWSYSTSCSSCTRQALMVAAVFLLLKLYLW